MGAHKFTAVVWAERCKQLENHNQQLAAFGRSAVAAMVEINSTAKQTAQRFFLTPVTKRALSKMASISEPYCVSAATEAAKREIDRMKADMKKGVVSDASGSQGEGRVVQTVREGDGQDCDAR